MKNKFLKMAFAGLVLSVSGLANAVPIISDFTGGSAFSNYYGGSSGDVIGFSFTADIDLSVTALGLFDDGNDGILNSNHMVGLWDMASQTLLGSASISNSDTLTNGFFNSTLASAINLFAGMDYILGAVYSANNGDSYFSNPSTVTTNYISNTQGVYPSSGNLGLVFPTGVSVGNLGRIGPNLLAEPTTSVPEPSTLAILGLGLMGLAVRRFKKQA